ncbi:MAG: glycosyltransferase [Pyrinomonadaceae bacterium MAG19_C2-C3]|nr:glycosyltransferase [Pyrinomonadaceae bacterium MAG19_C2-C3]
MRVLHVVPSLNLELGGPSRVVPELTRALAAHDVTTEILTTTCEPGNSANITTTCTDGVTTHGVHVGQYSSFIFSLALTKWLWHNAPAYDVLHLHTVFAYPTLIASRIARRLNRPYIVAPHGMLEPWCLSYKAWKKRPYMRLVERRTLGRASSVQALSADEERNIKVLDISRLRTFVLPNGINADDFTVLPEREIFEQAFPQVRGKRIVLFMGRIDPKKGVDLLVRAFARVRQANPAQGTCLVIAGPDLIGYQATIENLVRDAGLQEHVVFTGMLDGELKLAALGSANVFALPSHSEGFSMAILEAMAAGCAVIISEACNFSEVGTAGAGLVIKTNVEDLTHALTRLLADDASRGEMGERGRTLVVESYDWMIIAEKLKTIYGQVISGEAVERARQDARRVA